MATIIDGLIEGHNQLRAVADTGDAAALIEALLVAAQDDAMRANVAAALAQRNVERLPQQIIERCNEVLAAAKSGQFTTFQECVDCLGRPIGEPMPEPPKQPAIEPEPEPEPPAPEEPE